MTPVRALTFELRQYPNGDTWVIQCKEQPGLLTEGDTVQEALTQMADAINCFPEHLEGIGYPPIRTRPPTPPAPPAPSRRG